MSVGNGAWRENCQHPMSLIDDSGICACGLNMAYVFPAPAQELKTAQRLEALNRRRAVLIAYVQSKLEAEDWHAVGDAANDLRELDVEIRMTT